MDVTLTAAPYPTALSDPSTLTVFPTTSFGGVNPRDWVFGSSSATTASAALPYDMDPVSSVQILFAKIYVYAGVVFFLVTITVGVGWWIHMVLLDGSFHDVPDDLRFDVRTTVTDLLANCLFSFDIYRKTL